MNRPDTVTVFLTCLPGAATVTAAMPLRRASLDDGRLVDLAHLDADA